MTYDHIIKLLSIECRKNNLDELVEIITETPAYASLKSIGQTEKYQSKAAGLEPTLKFVLAEYLEYNNEKDIEFEGTRYRVLSTFMVPGTNTIELTCSHIANIGGVNNADT